MKKKTKKKRQYKYEYSGSGIVGFDGEVTAHSIEEAREKVKQVVWYECDHIEEMEIKRR